MGLFPSSSANAEPDIDDAQARVDQLFHEAEQASERYNDAKIELDALQDDVGSLQADEQRQDGQLERMRNDVKDSILRQYTGSTLGAVSQVVTSDDPTALLSQMSTLSSYNQIQNGLFDDYETGLKALDIRRDATQRRLGQVSEIEQQLADEKATIDEKAAAAKDLLAGLKEDERQAILSRSEARVPSDVPASAPASVPASVPASGRASAAVAYAMAQVGDAYVWAAAGPNAFDCSGLTMTAWAQAGVALPHSSAAQYAAGARVAQSSLQPGDLVFYYSPISHVAMYIGNGMIVDAANPGVGVRVAAVNSMPYAGAVRPG